jgi:hypothetical protein
VTTGRGSGAATALLVSTCCAAWSTAATSSSKRHTSVMSVMSAAAWDGAAGLRAACQCPDTVTCLSKSYCCFSFGARFRTWSATRIEAATPVAAAAPRARSCSLSLRGMIAVAVCKIVDCAFRLSIHVQFTCKA